MQLSLEIDPRAPVPLRDQLVGQIGTSITAGRLRAGGRLPGTRALSEQLGISRNTVLLAYEALAAEGFVQMRGGAGTFVSPMSPGPPPFPEGGTAAARRPAPRVAAPAFDFELESIDPDLFPGAIWRRLMTRHMASTRFNLTQPGDPKGSLALRQTLCCFLGASRGMAVEPDQIVVVAGIQQAMSVVARMLVRPGTAVIVESPGCSLIAPLYESHGAEIVPVPVDQDGLRVDALPNRGQAVAVVTPARHFPLGAIMPAQRRQALLDWAHDTGARVFEVDFDSDFRYEGSPQPALRALDRRGRFIYAGSFAMTIGPGLRIGYLVLPPALVETAVATVSLLDHAFPCQGQSVPWLEQAVLTDFIDSGGYDKHLRRLRKVYMERRDLIAAALARHFGPPVLFGMASGTHLVWRLPPGLPDAVTCEARARASGISVYTLTFRTIAGAETLPDWDRYLLLGFASLPAASIGPAVDALARAVR